MPDPVTLYVYDGHGPISGPVYREASPAEVLAHPAVLALVAENAALARECDRWRHGEPVEEDYVCPGDLRADAAEKECARLQAVLDAARNLILAADCPAYVWPMGPCGPTSWRGWDDDFAIPALMRKLDEAVEAADRAAEGREG